MRGAQVSKDALSYLFAGEEVAVIARPHPIVLVRHVLPAVAAIALFATFHNWFTFIVFLAVVIRVGWEVGLWWVDRYVLTTDRILSMSGLVTKKVVSLPLAKITDLTYARSVAGRIFGYGSMDLESAGQRDFGRIDYLPDPDRFYRAVMALALGPRPYQPPHIAETPEAEPAAPTGEGPVVTAQPTHRSRSDEPALDRNQADQAEEIVVDVSDQAARSGLNPDNDLVNTDEIPMIRRSDD